MTASPFTITVYDRALKRRGWIGDPASVNVTLRHNATSTAEVVIASDHPRVGDVMDRGARLVIDYDGRTVMSGPIVRRGGVGPASAATLTLGVDDDWSVLATTLAWPNPTGSITQQGAVTAYDRFTGPAENAVKHYADANFRRLGNGIVVAPSKGRGKPVTIQARMHPLTDRLFPAVEQAGIGVTVRQSGSTITLDCYTPTVRKRVLSEATGALLSWEWSSTAPGCTRTVVGGQGEGTAREFTQVVDPARELEWQFRREEFRDARDVGGDTTDDNGNTVTMTAQQVTDLLTARGQERLTEAAEASGLSVSLAESEGFRYGRHIEVGDTVTVELVAGVTITDTIREVALSYTSDQGLIVTPLVGARQDDPDAALRKTINDLARGLRALRAR